MKIHKIFAMMTIFSLTALPFWTEQFRVRKTQIVEISGDSVKQQSVTLGINDCLGIVVPADLSYLEGIEINVKIPSKLSQWRDAVAVSLYDDIKPSPSAAQIDYTGKRIFVTTLPTKLSWIFQIPLKKTNSLKDSIYTTKASVIPDISKKFTFIRFQPAMKGMPEDTMYSTLEVTVKPILINRGKLVVHAHSEDGPVEKYNLFIDEKQVSSDSMFHMLTPGLHNIGIQTDDYRSEVISVMIEQAKTTNADFSLKSLTPTLKLTAPDNSQIFLDGQEIENLNEEMNITEGEHSIRCLVGGYEIIRTITVKKGKSYKVNLVIDLHITEE